jgi:hypothetical protein
MKTYTVDFVADVEMVGDDPHPPSLTTAVRPNFVISDHYFLCFIEETTPSSGIGLHGKGAFKAHGVCSEEAVVHFTVGEHFELRSALRVFAKGTFREIVSVAEAEPAAS